MARSSLWAVLSVRKPGTSNLEPETSNPKTNIFTDFTAFR